MEGDLDMSRAKMMLFPDDVHFVAANYLTFLRDHLPEDLAERLYNDGLPDIAMPHQTVSVADLVRPLSSREFPADGLSCVADLTGYMVVCYEMRLGKESGADDLYKMAYVASLYLYSFIEGGGAPPASGYLAALRLMATASLKLDIQGRLQVCHFLGYLVPMLPRGSTDEPAPLSGLLLTMSIVLASIVSDLGVVTKDTMENEQLSEEWNQEEESEESSPPAGRRVVVLRQLVREMYGEGGRVRQAADRFLLAVQGRR